MRQALDADSVGDYGGKGHVQLCSCLRKGPWI